MRRRRAILIGFGLLAVAAVAVSPWLVFDSDPLDTKNPNTEAMRTLRDLINNPLTNPYTIDVLTPNAKAAKVLADKLEARAERIGGDQHQQFRAGRSAAEAGGDRRRQLHPGSRPWPRTGRPRR